MKLIIKKELRKTEAEKRDSIELLRVSNCDEAICDECGKANDKVVMVGEPMDYESLTAFICKECLEKALKLIL